MAASNSVQEAVPNKNILTTILRQPPAVNWDGENMNYKPYMLQTLLSQSQEYKRVASLFNATTRGLTISRIQRVENPYLLGLYLSKKEKMTRDIGSVQEESLFHGTRKCNVNGICSSNFDWRRRGRSRGHKFGQGVSFTPEASYARHYTFGDNVMILAKVLVGNSTLGGVLTVVPPKGYDTTENGKGTVTVKYEDDDFYPEYVIYYYESVFDMEGLRLSLLL